MPDLTDRGEFSRALEAGLAAGEYDERAWQRRRDARRRARQRAWGYGFAFGVVACILIVLALAVGSAW